MAKNIPSTDPTETATDPVESPTMDQFGEALTAIGSIAQTIAANQPKRKVTIGDYNPKSVLHPDGIKNTPKLTRKCYQNGVELHEDTLKDSEIRLLNRITHSGRYIDRKVEVFLQQNGSTDDVHIRYNNKRDAMFELREFVRNFEDMLTQVIAGQEAEVEQDKTYARRHR